jgi:hypothetical protein
MNQAKDTETDEANNGYQKSGIRFPQDSGERPILDRGEYHRRQGQTKST